VLRAVLVGMLREGDHPLATRSDGLEYAPLQTGTADNESNRSKWNRVHQLIEA
jgi:hypothetical protein